MGYKEGQQVVPEGEQMAHQVPLHGVDPLAVMTGLPHEVQQVIEPLLGLEGGPQLLGAEQVGEPEVDETAEVRWVPIREVEAY